MTKFLKSLAGALSIALLFSACASDGPKTVSLPQSELDPQVSDDDPLPRLALPQTTPDPKPRARPTFDAKQYVGQSPAAVERQLGKPSFKQQETFAEVWNYVSGPCVLHIYFYRPQGSAADAPLKAEQASIETRPGPWGDNLNPSGTCALEFSGRKAPAPATTQPTRRR